MKKSLETREKILNIAIELFYKNGYSETGINEILKESSSFKKSFYTHFSSKTELGIFYIKHIEKELLDLSNKLLDKYPNFEEFVSAWLRIIRNKLSKNYPVGCPLVNMPINLKEINSEVRSAFSNLKKPFQKYFQEKYQLPFTISNRLSEEILMLYEGAMNSYKLDPNKKYFDYMEKYLKSIDMNLPKKTE